MEPNYVNGRIGEKIKDLRNRNGLTQQELADRAELTKGYISQLERGQVAPSVVTLLDLIECLGTTPSEFFRETEEEHVVYSEEDVLPRRSMKRETVSSGSFPMHSRIRWNLFLWCCSRKEALAEDKPHEGEEFGYVISGHIQLRLGDNVYMVKAGESFYFSANKKHSIANTGAIRAKLIWVSTPPTF